MRLPAVVAAACLLVGAQAGAQREADPEPDMGGEMADVDGPWGSVDSPNEPRLDLHDADREALHSLPGMTYGLADAVVAEREARGAFADPAALVARVPATAPWIDTWAPALNFFPAMGDGWHGAVATGLWDGPTGATPRRGLAAVRATRGRDVTLSLTVPLTSATTLALRHGHGAVRWGRWTLVAGGHEAAFGDRLVFATRGVRVGSFGAAGPRAPPWAMLRGPWAPREASLGGGALSWRLKLQQGREVGAHLWVAEPAGAARGLAGMSATWRAGQRGALTLTGYRTTEVSDVPPVGALGLEGAWSGHAWELRGGLVRSAAGPHLWSLRGARVVGHDAELGLALWRRAPGYRNPFGCFPRGLGAGPDAPIILGEARALGWAPRGWRLVGEARLWRAGSAAPGASGGTGARLRLTKSTRRGFPGERFVHSPR